MEKGGYIVQKFSTNLSPLCFPRWRAKASSERNPQNAPTDLNPDADTYGAKYDVACSAFTIRVLLFISLANSDRERSWPCLCVPLRDKTNSHRLSLKRENFVPWTPSWLRGPRNFFFYFNFSRRELPFYLLVCDKLLMYNNVLIWYRTNNVKIYFEDNVLIQTTQELRIFIISRLIECLFYLTEKYFRFASGCNGI